MKTNQGAIILAERAVDSGRLSSVLREWGYEENDIQRVLKEQRSSREQEESDERTSQLTSAPHLGHPANRLKTLRDEAQ
jgi:hypothetical protein